MSVKIGLPSKQPKEESKLTDQHCRELRELQENCYKHLHRPCVVKARLYKEEIWYVCKKCLDKYMKKHEELKKEIIAFER